MNDHFASRRRSLRLKGYDYRGTGWYFVTVCVRDRVHLLGEIGEAGIDLNAAGEMVLRTWDELPERFPEMEVDERVVMPNHLHGIVVLADPERGPAPALGDIIGAFKSISTDLYIRGVRVEGWARFDGRLWQRNYYEHVIRDEQSLGRIREYIRKNPDRWHEDPENIAVPDSMIGARIADPGRAPTRGGGHTGGTTKGGMRDQWASTTGACGGSIGGDEGGRGDARAEVA